ncbi:MAG: LysR family transcriptional regulator [Myxococcota bacterium]|nr:LysR family transcriptional regulator [Deltaproteobacteria bacterium]MDQ3338818.1 LysR family transcriptional regulator [Myxococcota bacterium]
MRLSGIDLNLLTSLDALLAEQNVTRAAKRLGVSQPAVSHSLRRLRELLGDELLVRAKVGMTATPRALELRGAVRAALEAAEVVLRAAPAFDPATAERTFVVSMADQQSFVLLPPLVERLAREAPGIRIDVRPPPTDSLASDVELAIGVWIDSPANVLEQALWRESFMCVLRKGSAAARGVLDRKRYLALSHLLVAPRGTPGSFVDDLLAKGGERRNVTLRVPHFLVAPHVVATTDLVWTAPEGIARVFVEYMPLVLRDPPLRIDGFTVSMRWHARVDGDPGLAWLRKLLREVAPTN